MYACRTTLDVDYHGSMAEAMVVRGIDGGSLLMVSPLEQG